MSAMVLGLAGEILGYVGRVMSWKNQWSQNPFYIQICCLTVAPAFLSAGIYLCLRRIVTALGEDKSRIAPVWYTRIFIPCDLVSLILQVTGGALGSSSSHGGNVSDETGNHIMIASFIIQVVTLSIFICLAGDFVIRTYLAQGNLQPRVLYASNLSMLQRWGPTGFYDFLTALSASMIFTFWRCCFRVAELTDGWTVSLMKPVYHRRDLSFMVL
ncbi:hypothetical protein diail_11597 [Diaporthe ilicicola]|nr:hypothetical protein diail_11597 [Diaporthe ilicicola]